jgi:hypothetical protein
LARFSLHEAAVRREISRVNIIGFSIPSVAIHAKRCAVCFRLPARRAARIDAMQALREEQ